MDIDLFVGKQKRIGSNLFAQKWDNLKNCKNPMTYVEAVKKRGMDVNCRNENLVLTNLN